VLFTIPQQMDHCSSFRILFTLFIIYISSVDGVVSAFGGTYTHSHSPCLMNMFTARRNACKRSTCYYKSVYLSISNSSVCLSVTFVNNGQRV